MQLMSRQLLLKRISFKKLWTNRCISILFFLLTAYYQVYSQNHYISGVVEDAETGERLIGASIYTTNMLQGAISNNYGFYSIKIAGGNVSLQFSYTGYTTKAIEFILEKDTVLNINLSPSIALEEVTIKAIDMRRTIESTQMGVIELPLKTIKSIPFMLGETDILKGIQLMPGIQSGTEGSSGLYVRGGSPDQNLFLLDGVPMYNASHLFGFISVFNSDAIRNITVIKGGFPARYGSRLSSVIDIRMKEGNNQQLHGEGSLGIVASRFSLEGPIIKNKTSFIVSARRSLVDIFAQPVIKSIDDFIDTRYYFYDLNAKINHQLNKNNKLFLSLYSGNDVGFYQNRDKYIYDEVHYTLSNKMGLQWGNITSALRWNSILSNRLFCNTTLTFSKFNFKVYELNKKTTKPVNTSLNSRYNWEYLSGIKDYSAKTDFDFIPNSNHYLRFGGSYTWHHFKPGTNNFDYQGADYTDMVDTTYGDKKLNASEMDIYIEDDVTIAPGLKINAGLHGSSFLVRSKEYFSLQPRFSVRYMITDKISLKGSASNMVQYIHLLTNTSISLPTDLWLPATDKVGPENSWQYSLGMVFPVKKILLATCEGFYKTMNNVLEYKDGYTFLKSKANWEEMVEKGHAWSYGMEMLLEKREGKTTGWIGYTLSWSYRQFDGINGGRLFPFKYDRRHDISLVITHKLNEKVDIGAVWVFGSGTALTMPRQRYLSAISLFNEEIQIFQYYQPPQSEITYYKNRNSFRMPAYHRLDLSVNFHKKIKWGERTLSLGLYNAYSRSNAFYVYLGKNYDWYGNGSGEPVVKKVSLFPIIPFINYSFKF